MSHGKVIWFNENKGYGFIEQSDGKEVYFHYTSISNENSPKKMPIGSKVYFELLDTSTGLEASNVRVMEMVA